LNRGLDLHRRALGGFRLVALPGLHQVADGLAERVQFGLFGIQFGLRRAPLFIDLQCPSHQGLGIDVPFGKALFDLVAVIPQERQFEHGR
jgi:hypothetical protein